MNILFSIIGGILSRIGCIIFILILPFFVAVYAVLTNYDDWVGEWWWAVKFLFTGKRPNAKPTQNQ